MTAGVLLFYAAAGRAPRAREGKVAVARMDEGVREVRRFMKTLEQGFHRLSGVSGAGALEALEQSVWSRVRAQAAAERQWRAVQMLAVSLALVTGVALGGAEANAVLLAQPPAFSLTAQGLAPSDLLEGRP
jgi:hypothetical protein